MALVLALSGLTACAPASMQGEDSDPGGVTGFSDPRGAPYTVGGDPRLLGGNDRKNPNSPTTSADLNLAKTIIAINWNRLDASGKIDRLGKSGVRVSLTLDSGATIEFEGPIKATTAGRYQSKAISSLPKGYTLTLDVTDDSLRKESSGIIGIKKIDSKGKAIAQFAIFTRNYEAKVQTLPSEDQKLNALNLRLLRLVKEDAKAWVSNIIVEKARSFYDVHVYAAADSSAGKDRVTTASSGQRLFSFGGEAKRSGDFIPADAKPTVGLMKPLSVQLIGDAETFDQRTFAVLIEGQENQNIDVALKIERSESEVTLTPPPGVRGVHKESFFPVQYKDARLPRVTKTIDDFERNYSLPEVQTWIKRYTGPTPHREQLQKLLEGTAPMRRFISAVFQHFDVAPPAAVVTWLESPNYYLENYKLETNAQGSATGPFQITAGTASGLGMNVFKNSNGKLPPAWDERLYFAPSTCGAAKHFRESLNRFVNKDATLILLAYHMGDGGVEGALQKRSSAQKYALTYRDLANQRILKSEYATYVARALALYFVIGNPKQYEYDLPTKTGPVPMSKILPAKGITDAECMMAISQTKALSILKP